MGSVLPILHCVLPRELSEKDVNRLESSFQYMAEKARRDATWLLVDTSKSEAHDHFNEATGKCKPSRDDLING